MVATSGTVVRPSTGQTVNWHLAPVLVRLAGQAEALGWTVYSIGNASHLAGTGDHTPWSAGKTPGVVYAIDVMVPSVTTPAFEQWLIGYCRSNADTTWIDFFNLNGSQYNYAGQRLKSSADIHLHLSARLGKENASSGLFNAWKLFVNPPPPPPPPKVKTSMKLFKLKGDTTNAIYRTDGWFYEHLSPAAFANLRLLFGEPIEIPSLDGLRPVVAS